MRNKNITISIAKLNRRYINELQSYKNYTVGTRLTHIIIIVFETEI